MLRSTKEWDIRCPQALANLFPVRKGYYFKINHAQAEDVMLVLSKAYDIKPPLLSMAKPTRGANGECYYKTNSNGELYSIIRIHARGHIKTTFHEWYHHLDWMTSGKYNSNDRQGGPSSLAWQFADRMFDVFRTMKAK
jgi:hypothetical protein